MVPVANLVSSHGAPANIPFPFPFPFRSSSPTTPNHSSLPLPSTSPYPLLRHSTPRRLISSLSLPATAAISLPSPASPMAVNDAGSPERVRSPTPYEEVLNCLSSLITRKERGDGTNRGCQFDLMFVYVKMLDLEEDISKLKVIHVAGTKGKGSTCSFTESILRSCGIRTGLFTSPHLIDIRERFKLDGMEISEEKFMSYFWWCWDKLQEKTNDTVPMPTFFRFLALLALKIFSAEQVDVAILEVGLGGRFDATNVVKAPVVCGVSSLGYDHMEILGNTLELIASEKAGIFKEGVPAYTVPQPEEAMSSLENKASQLDVPLTVASPLDAGSLRGRKLGLDGEHQYLNAGLAVALCRAWLKETGHSEGMYLDDTSFLPEQFIHGLTTTSLSGRAQIVPDLQFRMQSPGILTPGGLIFYLDGAHSPESLEMCARWFSREVKEDSMHEDYSEEQIHNYHNAKQILLFNCMSVRDPHLLLPRLVNACADQGVRFHKAVFVPNQSLYHKVDSHAVPTIDPKVDLSWQQKLQRVWDNLANGDKSSRVNGYSDNKTMGSSHEERTDINLSVRYLESSTIFSSLPLAIKWLRDTAQENQSVRFQVLVTGSLHLVGDVLRLIKK